MRASNGSSTCTDRLDLEYAAYLPFYPACWTTYIEDEQVSERPIRIFHGTADNWAPIEPCRKYVMRLRKHGKDAQLIEYPGALHVFDAPGEFIKQFPEATGLGTCEREERPGGLVVNRATGEPRGSQVIPVLQKGQHSVVTRKREQKQ